VHEWFDDEANSYRIEARVVNRRWGPLFGYRGTFDVETIPVTDVPTDVLPRRVERRE
jgi:hypothetical protein